MRMFISASVSHLELPSAFRKMKLDGVNFNGLTLEKEGSQINFLNDRNIVQELGTINNKELMENPCLYMNLEIGINEKNGYLNDFAGITGTLMTAFWLVKDNACSIRTTISKFSDNSRSYIQSPGYIRKSIGDTSDTIFSREEIGEAAKWLNLLLEETIFENDEELSETVNKQGVIIKSGKNLSYNKTKRFQRGVRFIAIARRESFLSAKITFYISALEALLSDTNVELRHQVADRSARILSRDFDERIEILKTVSQAYEFRSKYIHGTASKQVSEGLLMELDDILRRLIKRFLTDLKPVLGMKENEFRGWIKELVYK